MTAFLLTVAMILALALGLAVGVAFWLWRAFRRERALNQALMDGAARNLMGRVAPSLAAALDRLGDKP